jgi:hypothetical protein
MSTSAIRIIASGRNKKKKIINNSGIPKLAIILTPIMFNKKAHKISIYFN